MDHQGQENRNTAIVQSGALPGSAVARLSLELTLALIQPARPAKHGCVGGPQATAIIRL